jgi:hypothetical protein
MTGAPPYTDWVTACCVSWRTSLGAYSLISRAQERPNRGRAPETPVPSASRRAPRAALAETVAKCRRSVEPSFDTSSRRKLLIAGNLRHGHGIVSNVEAVRFFHGWGPKRLLPRREKVTHFDIRHFGVSPTQGVNHLPVVSNHSVEKKFDTSSTLLRRRAPRPGSAGGPAALARLKGGPPGDPAMPVEARGPRLAPAGRPRRGVGTSRKAAGGGPPSKCVRMV